MSSLRTRPCEDAIIQSTSAEVLGPASAKPWVLIATILASSIANIDEFVINVALPAIETDLATSIITIQWLVNAYTLCLSAFLLVGGASADQFGRRRFFIVGVSIFAASSLWCGIAPSLTQLISARAAQGVGAALLIPCSLALIGANFDESERGKAIGTWAGSSGRGDSNCPIVRRMDCGSLQLALDISHKSAARASDNLDRVSSPPRKSRPGGKPRS